MLKCGHAWMTHRSIVSFQARITWFPKERHPLCSSGKVIHSAKCHDHRPGRSGVNSAGGHGGIPAASARVILIRYTSDTKGKGGMLIAMSLSHAQERNLPIRNSNSSGKGNK